MLARGVRGGDFANRHLCVRLTADVARNDKATQGTKEMRHVTNRRVGANVLCDTGSFAGRVVEVVAEHARRLRVFGELAGSAGELQLEVALVLLGVKHVGAFRAESEGYLLELLGLGRLGCGGLRRRHIASVSWSAVVGVRGRMKRCVREVWAVWAVVDGVKFASGRQSLGDLTKQVWCASKVGATCGSFP